METQDLKGYLRNDVLKTFIPDEKIRDMLTSDKAMAIWNVIFTHESSNPNIGSNYEEDELLGDKILGANFVKYLMKLYKRKLGRAALTELVRYYMSKTYQATMSQQLGLDQWVVMGNIQATTHIAEDVFEAFCSGLDETGDLIKPGFGNLLCYNFIVYMFKDVKIDMNVTKGHPKTQVKEIFDKLEWGGQNIPEENVEDAQGNPGVRILLPPVAMKDLRAYQFSVVSPIIAEVYSTTSKKMASDDAYRAALLKLRNMGITEEWVEQIKARKLAANPILAPLFQKAYARMRNDRRGITDIYFKTVQTRAQGKQMQLIGLTKDEKQVILAETARPVVKAIDGQAELLASYASS